ncbi:MAG: hypothetical protein EAZ95_07010 [Bacteroidetes bacterium]|nr:MAG: hypothetical protein EAZ95_07010 [Bacteroidota bacterium]
MGIREAIETALKEQGKIEGVLKGDKKSTFGMLSEGLLPETIARITKQPLETILEWKKEWEASLA